MLEFLKKFIRFKTSELEAKLAPTPACTHGGRGEIELESWSDGGSVLEASLKHAGLPNGSQLEVVCAGHKLATITVNSGYAKEIVRYTEAAPPPPISVGDTAEFQLDGQTLYQGVFHPD